MKCLLNIKHLFETPVEFKGSYLKSLLNVKMLSSLLKPHFQVEAWTAAAAGNAQQWDEAIAQGMGRLQVSFCRCTAIKKLRIVILAKVWRFVIENGY